MEVIKVKNSGPLKGSVRIDGAKNAALPILAASILGTEEIILDDVPNLTDIELMIGILRSLGAEVEHISENSVRIDPTKIDKQEADANLMNKMRASFVVMGPLLAKFGKSIASMPGGCAIGARPIDLHLKGFVALGAVVEESETQTAAVVPNDGRLIGNKIYLDFPSVGATQNIMMAASLAKGQSVIENAAKEPEIVDLANFLNKMGAKVKGAGTSTITIDGVEKLTGTRHTIIPDRIEAATFMVAAAMTKGDVLVENVIASHIKPIIAKLKEMGCEVIEDEDGDIIRVIGAQNPIATNIKTLPYPGFPTDAQSQFMTYMTICEGTSKVVETVFENRFMHVDELLKMGAFILSEEKQVAKVMGVDTLKGTKVRATDLRAGAALVVAGLVAEGTTTVMDIYHIDRGYYDYVGKLQRLGANIARVEI